MSIVYGWAARVRTWFTACGGLICLCLVGCDADTGVQKVIGAAGGTITSPGGTTVVIPPGALTSDVTIEIRDVGVESLSAAAPAPMQVVAGAVALLPHGLTFAVPVSVELPAPSPSTAVLRLDDERDVTWERVATVDLDAGKAHFEILTFSVYAPAEPDPQAPMARGLLSSPEVIPGGKVPAGFLYFGGHYEDLLYWPVTLPSGMSQIRRARLAETIVVEAIYEEYDELLIAAVGPDADAVYFFRPAVAMIARLPHDLSTVALAWSDVSGLLSQFTHLQGGGTVVGSNVYVALLGDPACVRIPLTGGAPMPTPFPLPSFPSSSRTIGEGFCAFSPDRNLAACGYSFVVDFTNETATDIKNNAGQVVGGGELATDGTAFFFMPPTSFPSVDVYRLGYGESVATVFTTTGYDVLKAAGDVGKIYLGVQTDSTTGEGRIIALDSTSGAVLGQVTMNPAPSDGFLISPPYLYYGNAGADLQRIRLDAIAP